MLGKLALLFSSLIFLTVWAVPGLDIIQMFWGKNRVKCSVFDRFFSSLQCVRVCVCVCKEQGSFTPSFTLSPRLWFQYVEVSYGTE